MIAVLVGCGSIGKRHLEKLSKRCDLVYVVDPNLGQEDLDYSTNSVKHFKDLSTLSEYLQNTGNDKVSQVIDIGIVANWGPDHMTSMKALVSLGLKKILIEKPIVTNISDLKTIEEYSKNGLIIWSNYHIRFSKGVETILKFQKDLKLNSPNSIHVIGGAKCISTNGIHWMDFARMLFKQSQTSVQAMIDSQFINPRNKEFLFLEGSLNCRFEDKKILSINYINNSYFDNIILIMWEKFIGEIRNGVLSIYTNSSADFSNRAKARTCSFEDLVLSVDFFESGFDTLYEEFFKSTTSISNLIDGNLILLTALVSSSLKREVNFNDSQLTEFNYSEWKIS
jgi:predicted dehydrogenase